MKKFSSFPLKDNPENWEIFNHDDYLKTSEDSNLNSLGTTGAGSTGISMSLIDNILMDQLEVNSFFRQVPPAPGRLFTISPFDALYISESQTNIATESGSPAWNGVDVRNSVWFGFGRTWNASLRLNF